MFSILIQASVLTNTMFIPWEHIHPNVLLNKVQVYIEHEPLNSEKCSLESPQIWLLEMDFPSFSQNGDITRKSWKERLQLVYLMNLSTRKWDRTPDIAG